MYLKLGLLHIIWLFFFLFLFFCLLWKHKCFLPTYFSHFHKATELFIIIFFFVFLFCVVVVVLCCCCFVKYCLLYDTMIFLIMSTYTLHHTNIYSFQSWLWRTESWVLLPLVSWDLQPILRPVWLLCQRYVHGPDIVHCLLHPEQPGLVQVCWPSGGHRHRAGIPVGCVLHEDSLQVSA